MCKEVLIHIFNSCIVDIVLHHIHARNNILIVVYEFEKLFCFEHYVRVNPHDIIVVNFTVKGFLVCASLNRCTEHFCSRVVDIAEIILRECVINFVFGKFTKEISPTLQKSAGLRCPRQTKYNFHNVFLFSIIKYRNLYILLSSYDFHFHLSNTISLRIKIKINIKSGWCVCGSCGCVFNCSIK